MGRFFSSGGSNMTVEGVKSFESSLKETAGNGWRYFDGVLKVIYESISDLNLQLPESKRIEQSLGTVLFGAGSKLDSLGLANFIVITEQRLEDHFGFPVDLTEDDPFSPSTGHFRTIQSLTTYVCESAERKSGGATAR